MWRPWLPICMFAILSFVGEVSGAKLGGKNVRTREVVAELREFVGSVAEPGIQKYRQQQIDEKSKEDCFATNPGLHLRHRCCVIFTNIAAGLIHQQYGDHCWDRQKPCNRSELLALGPDALNYLMRVWAVQNEERDGIYEAEIEVAGVRGKLTKCEFLDVHTYLTFQAPQIFDVLIDVTYKQFLVIPELMNKRSYKQCVKKNMFSEQLPYFVGTERQMKQVINTTVLQENMARFAIAPEEVIPASRWVDILFSATARKSVCGKPTQKQRQTEELKVRTGND